jgi:catechol 2,3-dioxygenase-like lactoylglutathione lyase family enzyme
MKSSPMPIADIPSIGARFGLTSDQSDYALELVFHAVAGAWIAQDHVLMPVFKALIKEPTSLSDAQIFCALHTVLGIASEDWEAPILTGRTKEFAQVAGACLRFEAHSGPLQMIDHVQVAIPKGGEVEAQGFYQDLLGLTEIPKPPSMAARGGAWYEARHIKVHLGVETPFRPNDKAHVAFLVEDVAALAKRAEEMGYKVKQDQELPAHERAFLYDPFGNRIEVLRPTKRS